MAATETDEIEKIMSEIEELQKEMSSDSNPTPTAPAATTPSTVEEDILTEIQATAQTGGGAGDGLEDTLAELKDETPGNGALAEALTESEAEAVVAEAEVQEEETMPKTESGNDGTLSLTLTGNMTLRLKYEFEGQEVTISFVDQSLRVQMTDGTEFKVPVVRGGTTTAQSSGHSNVKPFKKAV